MARRLCVEHTQTHLPNHVALGLGIVAGRAVVAGSDQRRVLFVFGVQTVL